MCRWILGLLLAVCLCPVAYGREWLPFAGFGYDARNYSTGVNAMLGVTTPLDSPWPRGLPLELTGALSGSPGTGAGEVRMGGFGCGGDRDYNDCWFSASEVLRVAVRRSGRPEFRAPEMALGIGLHHFWQWRTTGYSDRSSRFGDVLHQARGHLLLRLPFGFSRSACGPVIEAESQANLGHWQLHWAPDFSLRLGLGFRFAS